MKKQNKGITLISLVITIIILLILAGISISAIISGNGLFIQSKKAKEKYENAQELEMSILNSYNDYMDLEGDTADELLKKLEEGTENSIAGREVTYIKYKDKDGNEQDKWIIVYIGKNKDTAEDIAADMPTNENHIYLLPKYSVMYVAPVASKITINTSNNIVEANLDSTAGYSSTVAFKDAMRDANNWNAYAKFPGSSAHGAMSVAQYNMCVEWGNFSIMGNGTSYWLDDPTWANAIARVDGDGGRSGNGLEYWSNGAYTLRPFVMLGLNCKLTSDNRIINTI